MKKIMKELLPYFVIVLLVVFIRIYIITPVIVVGDSMIPTLKEKQILLLNKIDYKFNDIERYDIIVIRVGNSEIIKRVIGLPGENIEYKNNVLYINGKEIDNKYNFKTDDFTLKSICNCDKIPKDKYLVLGDNRVVSADSRIIGLIDKKDIEGSTKLSIWPIKMVR